MQAFILVSVAVIATASANSYLDSAYNGYDQLDRDHNGYDQLDRMLYAIDPEVMQDEDDGYRNEANERMKLYDYDRQWNGLGALDYGSLRPYANDKVEQPDQGIPEPDVDQPRAQEIPERSNLMDFQSINVGDENSKTDPKEAKSDRGLPAYCNPPNPCPKGHTASKDNCVENFENTAENNREFNRNQKCECDQEHMFECPKEGGNRNTKSTVMDGDLSSLGMDNTYFGGEKREGLVAKKSPGMYGNRQKRMAEEMRGIPHQGTEGVMKRVAKKAPSIR